MVMDLLDFQRGIYRNKYLCRGCQVQCKHGCDTAVKEKHCGHSASRTQSHNDNESDMKLFVAQEQYDCEAEPKVPALFEPG